MLMSPIFKSRAKEQGDLVVTRAGVVKNIILPEAMKQRITYDANVEGTNVVMSAGDSVYILADEFGILHNSDYVDTNLLFVDGGVLIELIAGTIVLKGEDGTLFTIDELGEIDYPKHNRKMHFVRYTDIYANALRLTKVTYGTPDDRTHKYVDNLVLNVSFIYESTVGEPVLTTRISGYYESLGLNAFQFINYNDVDMFNNTDDGFDPDELDEEEEEEQGFEMNMEDDDEFGNSF